MCTYTIFWYCWWPLGWAKLSSAHCFIVLTFVDCCTSVTVWLLLDFPLKIAKFCKTFSHYIIQQPPPAHFVPHSPRTCFSCQFKSIPNMYYKNFCDMKGFIGFSWFLQITKKIFWTKRKLLIILLNWKKCSTNSLKHANINFTVSRYHPSKIVQLS